MAADRRTSSALGKSRDEKQMTLTWVQPRRAVSKEPEKPMDNKHCIRDWMEAVLIWAGILSPFVLAWVL